MSADAWDQGVMMERAAENAFDKFVTSGDYTEWEVWVCPRHGVIGEDELLEGHDGTMFGSTPEGDPYTGEFFCARDHAGTNPPAVQHDIRSGPWSPDA